MPQTYPKRLIEVDLPIARISAHARREKSIRHGHISTLHIWWARRPLAACRAVICAALWPDPVQPLCPPAFRAAASAAMIAFARRVNPERITEEKRELQENVSEQSRGRWEALAAGTLTLDPADEADWFMLRMCLLDFIADFANWDNSTLPAYLETSRFLTAIAHASLSDPGFRLDDSREGGQEHSAAGKSETEESSCPQSSCHLPDVSQLPRPLVVDPFAGGGSRSGQEDSAAGKFETEQSSCPQSSCHLPDVSHLPRPLVVDPFAGGGSIPLEALRVGADAFASDLNPVAVLLNKVVLEYIPKYGQKLAEEVRRWGEWIKREAEKDLAEFYPKDPDGATPIAYLWARTIRCEGPACGAEVPLVRSLWLAKKANRSIALKILTAEDAEGRGGKQGEQEKQVEFAIVERGNGEWKWRELPPSFASPRSSAPSAVDPDAGTVKRGSATCPCCGYTTPVAQVRTQLKTRKGGAADAKLLAVVTTRADAIGRFYRLPIDRDLNAVANSAAELERRKKAHQGPLSLVPEELTPRGGGSGAGRAFSQRHYGMVQFCDVFTPRQLLALTALARLTHVAGQRMTQNHEPDLANAVQAGLALCVDKVTDLGNAFCPWEPVAECPRNLFARQAIPMGWNFGEGVPIGESSGAFAVMVDRFDYVLSAIGSDWRAGEMHRGSATEHLLPDAAGAAFVTDPPYYDAVPYADLSDFFYVWLKRTLPMPLAGAFAEELTPKADECIVDEVKGKDKAYFENTMGAAMAEGRRVLAPSGIAIVVFAHKSTAGWEAQLQAMVDAGWTITGSWAIDTEMSSRFRARDSAALASSVHLVCRPREDADGSVAESVGEWRDVLGELPGRIHEWMPRLAAEGVVGADAIFACLGPALEILALRESG